MTDQEILEVKQALRTYKAVSKRDAGPAKRAYYHGSPDDQRDAEADYEDAREDLMDAYFQATGDFERTTVAQIEGWLIDIGELDPNAPTA